MSLQSRVYGFIPTSITGCILWLDAADASSVTTSGTTVTAIRDKSARATVLTSPAGFTYPNNTFNGAYPSFYNTSASGGRLGYNTTYSLGSQNTVFIVGQLTSPSAGNQFFDFIDGYTSSSRFFLFSSPNNLYNYVYGTNGSSSGQVDGTITNAQMTSPFFWSVASDTSTNVSSTLQYVNGTQLVQSPSDTLGAAISSYTGIIIGQRFTQSSESVVGHICEFIIFNNVLTTTQRHQVEAYLAQKWGLKSSLPVGHPGLGETIYRSDFTKQNVMTARPFYTAFSPRQISGCALWLDAADPAGTGVLPASGTLTTWTDKSTAGNNATGGVSPTYSSTTKAVSFNGSSTYLQTSLSAVPSNETFFAIFTSTIPISNANRFNCIIGASGNNGRDINVLTSFAGNSSAYDLRYDSWAVGSISLTGYGGITFNTLTLATTQFTGGQGAGSTYGSNFGSFQSLSFSSSSTTRIGAGNGGDYFTGTINEIIMYNTVLGLSDRQKLESYLAQKWGLTASLPGGHLNATQPAGAITLTALTNFRILSRSRGSPITSTTLNTIATYLRNYMSEFRNPSFYGYNLDGNSYHINDGGGDMYDAGNWTNPWLIAGTQITGASSSQQAFTINYAATTATTVDTSFIYASLGYAASSGTTITSNHPLTVLGFRDTTGHPVGFQLAGNSGADGSGTLASGILYAGDIIQGFTVHAFYRETYNAGDPSHCNLFILLGHPSWISVFGTISSFADPVANGGNGCFFYTSGAGVSNILAIQTLLSKSGGVLVTAAECQTVVQAFVDRVKLAVGF